MRDQIEQHLLAMLSGDVRQRHSALHLVRDAHRGDPNLADIIATPKVVQAVGRELEKMLGVRAKDWGEAASRCAACEVLGRYGDRKCIPVLLRALDEPFVSHHLAAGPDGAEHHYNAIWWDADEALRQITGASPLPKPARHVGPEDEDQVAARAAWLKWWRENDVEVLFDQQFGKWRYRVFLQPASSRSRWTIGELSFDGEALTAESTGHFMWTPWGKLIFHERQRFSRGWLSPFYERPTPQGREIPSPDADSSRYVRQRHEALSQSGESFRLDIVYRDGDAGGWFSLAPGRPVTEFPPGWRAWQVTLPKGQVPIIVDRIAAEGLLARALAAPLLDSGLKGADLEIQFRDGKKLWLLLFLKPTAETVEQLRRITQDVGDAAAQREIKTMLDALKEFARCKATETQPSSGPSHSTYPYLAPEQRPQKAKEALDPATGDKARFYAVWGLAINGYTQEGAEALAVIASDSKYETTTRGYAGMGLRNFSSAMPEDVRKAIQDRLYGALESEREKLPDGVMRTLIGWGDADRVRKLLGEKLRGHHMEIEVLQRISSRQEAIARLMELYEAAGGVTVNPGWNQRWRVGAALIEREDKRGIDILLECLTVKEPWPIDDPSPQAKESNAASFRQCLHNTFAWLARLFDEDFGYEARGKWMPALGEARAKMVTWWQANRQTWNFGCRANVEPAREVSAHPYLQPEQRPLAAKAALDPATDEAARYRAIWGLAISGYCRESAEVLAVVACDRESAGGNRWDAAMGLINFTSDMPADERRAIQDRLHGALDAEREDLPDGVMRTLIYWGDADRIRKVLGEKLRGHSMEIPVLERVSARDYAVARLWEIYQASPPVAGTGNVALSRRWHVGYALILQRDKRGIDILLECMTVKEAKNADSARFRHSVHFTFLHLASVLRNYFGYEVGPTWSPQLAEAIQKMVAWWKANREKWRFEDADAAPAPKAELGKPLDSTSAKVVVNYAWD